MNKIGIIGQGYVGEAVKLVFEKNCIVETYDINKSSSCKSIEELLMKTDIIFICLPTPMNLDGSCNISIVDEVLKEIDRFSKSNHLIAIKSTIPPKTTDFFKNKYQNISILFNPEFLTEANYIDDFRNQNRIIIGGNNKEANILYKIYKNIFTKSKVIITDPTTAEMIKYTTNTFLATKVSFANEIKQVCDSLNINYETLIQYTLHDKRIADSHLLVPGPDGKKGFGGSCFPKDINALISLGKELKINLNVIEGAWKTNLSVRPKKDWEKLKGRAVSE